MHEIIQTFERPDRRSDMTYAYLMAFGLFFGSFFGSECDPYDVGMLAKLTAFCTRQTCSAASRGKHTQVLNGRRRPRSVLT